MCRFLAVLFVAFFVFESVACAVGPSTDAAGTVVESGLDYQKLLAKLEILDTKITRVETSSREQFASLESKLDSVFRQIDSVNQAVQGVQRDVQYAREEIQLLKNVTQERLYLLAGSISTMQSVLVEGRQQKLVPKSESPVQATQPEPTIFDSCDVVSRNASRIVKLLPEPGFGDAFLVFCDQEYEDGGWIVVQNRFNGSVDFYRSWKEYKNGFGNLNGEFWLGLDKLHALTYSAPYELHVLLEDFDNKSVVAKYTRFAIGNEQESYAITKLGDYNGTAGDGMGYHRNAKFTSMDVNHDWPGNNGGVDWTGAWWYRKGHHSNLNGQYLKGAVDHDKFHGKGMTWNPFRGDDYSLKRSRMMIRRTYN